MKQDLMTHWRDSAHFPRFFMLDARACLPFLIFFLHMRLATLLISIAVVLFLAVLNRFNLSLSSFMLILRETITGRKKTIS